ncbi:TetR/AcrR family transcriptional regulator [Actinorhabdospora filicis]|nr:TetR/AcrR family transcriptional regulator [Actinorhabdospora filicis]
MSEEVPAKLRRLWRRPETSRLGRPATLDVETVVAAAVALADRDGLAGVTLPKVAAGLGVTGMSLYRHVGSKDELLELMHDAALGDPPVIADAGWRAGLRAWAVAQRAVLLARPWLVAVPTSGAPSGPNVIAWMECALAVMAGTRLDWARKIGVLTLVGGYVRQSARQTLELAAGRGEETQAEAEAAYGRALMGLVEPERFPQVAALFGSMVFETPDPVLPEASGVDFDFDLGLEMILDGVAVSAG